MDIAVTDMITKGETLPRNGNRGRTTIFIPFLHDIVVKVFQLSNTFHNLFTALASNKTARHSLSPPSI